MKPALITEEERRLISRHTKAALAVRKGARRLDSDGWTGDARRDQCAMTPPCGLSPSRSSGIRTHARAVNAADTRMSGVSRLPNAC